MRNSTFKMSRFYICVRLSHYVLCLQRLLCIENVLFQGTRFSTHKTLRVKIGIWPQILQYYQIFHLFISRFEIFIWPISHVLCLYKPSFNLKILRVCEYYSTHVILGVKNENWSQRLKLHISLRANVIENFGFSSC